MPKRKRFVIIREHEGKLEERIRMPDTEEDMQSKRQKTEFWVTKFIQKIIRDTPKNSNERKEEETFTCNTLTVSKKNNSGERQYTDNRNNNTNKIEVKGINKRE
jgi:hypothetical protein